MKKQEIPETSMECLALEEDGSHLSGEQDDGFNKQKGV